MGPVQKHGMVRKKESTCQLAFQSRRIPIYFLVREGTKPSQYLPIQRDQIDGYHPHHETKFGRTKIMQRLLRDKTGNVSQSRFCAGGDISKFLVSISQNFIAFYFKFLKFLKADNQHFSPGIDFLFSISENFKSFSKYLFLKFLKVELQLFSLESITPTFSFQFLKISYHFKNICC